MSRPPFVLHAFRSVTYKWAEKCTKMLLSVGGTFYVQIGLISLMHYIDKKCAFLSCGVLSPILLFRKVSILKDWSEICGNKMPTRCNRGFYCRSYSLLSMFRAPLCPSSGVQGFYTVVAACGISCCGFSSSWSGVELRVMRPVCRMLASLFCAIRSRQNKRQYLCQTLYVTHT